MNKKHTLLILILVSAGSLLLVWLLVQGTNIAVLNPQGMIAEQQRNLMVIATLLTLVVVVPVFILTFIIAWKYRAGNTKAKYIPEWDHDTRLEFIWWGVPFAVILVLSGIIWTSSHELDPYKQLAVDEKPITVQVVALQWKWLFIYPEYNIATVNYLQFPEKTPLNLEITADAPMNSFWIPSLGGQVYAMAGMETKLHLIANKTGMFNGSSANLSGEGFSGMKFVAEASARADFNNWVELVKQSPNHLSRDEYAKLARPSKNNPRASYSQNQAFLHDTIMMKYMTPPPETQKAVHEGRELTPEMQHGDMQGMEYGSGHE